MSRIAGTRRARSRSRTSTARGRARRLMRPAKQEGGRRRRRALTIGLALVALLAVGLTVANRERLADTIRELTLPLRHENVIRHEAEEHGVPADIVAAVIYVESRFRDQTSTAGARGLMQITPTTAEIIERLSGGDNFQLDDLADPDVNIAYGTFYLRHLLDKFDDNEVAALAAYNGGETNVARWGGSELEFDDIEFEETRDYVENVLEKREEYREHYGQELGLN